MSATPDVQIVSQPMFGGHGEEGDPHLLPAAKAKKPGWGPCRLCCALVGNLPAAIVETAGYEMTVDAEEERDRELYP